MPSPQLCSFPTLISLAENLPDWAEKKKRPFFSPLSLGTGERQPTLFAEESLSAINHWILN